jgi:hypothetical protein
LLEALSGSGEEVGASGVLIETPITLRENIKES